MVEQEVSEILHKATLSSCRTEGCAWQGVRKAFLDPTRSQEQLKVFSLTSYYKCAYFCRASLLWLNLWFKMFYFTFLACKVGNTFGFFKMSQFSCVYLFVLNQALTLSFCFAVLSVDCGFVAAEGLLERQSLHLYLKQEERVKNSVCVSSLLSGERSLLGSSHSTLLLRVASQNLVTWLPTATREVEKVGNRMVSVNVKQSWIITWVCSCCYWNRIGIQWAKQKGDSWMSR